jgi:scyllo-inositol 2-dehydrogenase (NADP+)
VRVIVVGLGVQGSKRQHIAADDCVATVDPIDLRAGHRDVAEVSLDAYDAALICTPDRAKFGLIEFMLRNGKHVLVEKPLIGNDDDLARIESIARSRGLVCYTAYNHRFEPHFVRMGALIASGQLGRIYHCRMFYGNGTARLVRESGWRDAGLGVVPDLGSHLLDTAAFWFGAPGDDFKVVSWDCFENRAPDHAIIGSHTGLPRLELEMTLLSWRNHFTCDIFAERGSAHIRSLCKWGPSSFTHRERLLPSGRPPEETITVIRDDPTWMVEYAHFKKLCATRVPADLGVDRWIGRLMTRFSSQIGRPA